MSALELILALAGLCIFISFVALAQGQIISALGSAHAAFQEKRSAISCAASMNFFYAHASGDFGLPQGCSAVSGRAAFGRQKSAVIFGAGAAANGGAKAVVEVQPHYG